MIYGVYKPPFEIKEKNIKISMKEKGGCFIYSRVKEGENIEKLISGKNFEIHINPVEPLNLPQEISPYFMISLTNSLLLAPKSKDKIYIKFPVEIAVFIKGKGDIEVIDIFSFVKNKFTLYGDITKGVICKYFESDIYKEIPDTDNLIEGIIELSLINQSKEWVYINKIVFNAYLMKIYFNEKLVSCVSRMEIKGKVIAETSFFDKPLLKGMNKSLELFTSRRLPFIQPEFVMEFGL